MVGVLGALRWSVVVLPARVQSTELLLGLFLVENVQVRPMRRLYRNNQALVIRNTILCRYFRTIVVPNWQVFQVFVSDISKVSVLRVSKDLFLLFLKICDQVVEFCLCLVQLLLFIKHFKISIAKLWIHIFEGVFGRVIDSESTRFL